MPIQVRDGGAWKQVNGVWVRDAGTWKEAEVSVRDAGVWQSLNDPAVFEFTDEAETTSTSDPHTYSNLNIGAASADRMVLVFATARGDGGGSRTISAISIGGTNGTLHVKNTVSHSVPTAIAYRLVPTGTTATISVSASGGDLSRGYVAVGTLKNYRNPTPSPGLTSHGTTNSRSLIQAVETGGVGFWLLGISTVSGSAVTWSNVTEVTDEPVGTSLRGTLATYSNGGGSISGQASWSASTLNCMCAMAWR